MTKTVCIVGAGPSGLVAAKTLLHNAPKDAFKVSVFDSQAAIGGLWPVSKTDNGRLIHPLMITNQSRHTMHFSDLAWERDAPQLPRAWMIGKYLERYMNRHLTGQAGFDLQLRTRVVGAEPAIAMEGNPGWHVRLRMEEGEKTERFDYLLVASGHFGKPMIPECLARPSLIPVIHSSRYRDLKDLLVKATGKGKILVVGGQMSGVEIAATIASHLSSAAHAPGEADIPHVDRYTVHHVLQRPVWVFPHFTTPEPKLAAPPFLPIDFASYNSNSRPQPLVNTQGHVAQDVASVVHGVYENVLGTNQSQFSPLLRVDGDDRTAPPYLAVSDWYCDFVRSGLITLSKGKVESLVGTTAVLSDGAGQVEDVAAVVVATGFDPSPSLDFLPRDTLERLQHSPRHTKQPLALAFHGTHHPEVPNLGFVGFYRSPYWGIMQMQARFLAEFWSGRAALAAPLSRRLAADDSIQRTLSLRNDVQLSQFPMGDYQWLMQEFAEALSMERASRPSHPELPRLTQNDEVLDTLTPSRFTSPTDDDAARESAALSVQDTLDVTAAGLGTPTFISRAVFRSLLGTWKLHRQITSRLPSHPSGSFGGTAQFLLREKSTDGTSAGGGGDDDDDDDDDGLEYLYVEAGEFTTDSGFRFPATRRYVWRYDERKDLLSVWFTKPDDDKRADYLFHEIEFEQPTARGDESWRAKAGHLCVDDYYDVKYRFAFDAVNLRDWSIEYTVNGPKKDYSIRGAYSR
ncbi:hypothetical protein RJ55_06425 [Drechmeria coniospora]|nr:hypothetical protein RJ55_06425 [Drechmeria coniospora]